MELILSTRVGFCFGVKLCIESINSLFNKGYALCMLTEVVHSELVLKYLQALGMRVINDVNDLMPGEILILGAHGSSKGFHLQLKALKIIPLPKTKTLSSLSEKYFFDAVCPFVARIHKIVSEISKEKILVVLGNKSHCEVEGIVSYASGSAFVFPNISDFENFLIHLKFQNTKPIAVVFQTTFNHNEEKKCRNCAKSQYANCEFFDTICNETKLRQAESNEIADKSDLVLVLGSKKSNNTVELLNVCQRAKKAVLIEKLSDLAKLDFTIFKRIGIVTGASAPLELFEEVKEYMGSLNEKEVYFDFMEELERSCRKLHVGEQITGCVVKITQSEIQLDINAKYAAYIPASEFTDSKLLEMDVHVGGNLEAVIKKINDAEGFVELSVRDIVNQVGFDEVKAAVNTGIILTGKIVKILDVGVIVEYKGVDIFIHNSQLEATEDRRKLLWTEVPFKVSFIDERRKSAKGSVRVAKQAQKEKNAQKIWNELEVGQVRTAVVKSLVSYGVFVDIGGVNGLIHISELSWDKLSSAEGFFNVGETIEVKIKSLDEEKKQIALVYKKEEDNPWLRFCSKFKTGDVVESDIVAVKKFGIFVGVFPGIDGFIHISELAKNFTKDPFQNFHVGDIVKAKIIEMDNEAQRVKMSIKVLQETKSDLDHADLSSTEKAVVDDVQTEE
ncbi:MAG: S1 RNA-binding domain-containing protein [Oscillospiraceae bacterium]|nr:S1 RNA-binding domain-containing protein [Oscillospiraceae bacterium]